MKRIYVLTVLFALSAPAASPALCQDMFKDVPADIWNPAVNDLHSAGILKGYPNGYFQGKRMVTRYEFAVALKRALETIAATQGATGQPGMAGPAGSQGPQGRQGPIGPPGAAPLFVEDFLKLTEAFKSDLAGIRLNTNTANQRLDASGTQIETIDKRLDKNCVNLPGDRSNSHIVPDKSVKH